MVSIANQSTSSLLMIPAGSETPPEGDPFETLTSMRNVDKECNAIIINSYKGKLWGTHIKERLTQKEQLENPK